MKTLALALAVSTSLLATVQHAQIQTTAHPAALPAATNQPAAQLAEELQVAQDAEMFRLELINIWSNYLELGVMLGNSQLEVLARDNLQQVQLWAPEDVEALKSTGMDVWRHSILLQHQRDRVSEMDRALRGPADSAVHQFQSAGFPNASYSALCGSVRSSTDALFIAQTVLETAQGIWSVASRGCDEVIVILGAGGNLSLVCIAADAILFAAQLTFDSFVFCDADIDSAEIEGSYDRLGHLHTDLETVQSGITASNGKADALQLSLNAHDNNIDRDLVTHNANIDADLVNHDTNIRAELAAHDLNIDTDLNLHDLNLTTRANEIISRLDNLDAAVENARVENLRLQIHRNLSQSSGNLNLNRVLLYQIPEAHGGHLGLVRQVVEDSKSLVMGAGLLVDPLYSVEMANGDADMAVGKYKQAYDHYRKAYQHLATI